MFLQVISRWPWRSRSLSRAHNSNRESLSVVSMQTAGTFYTELFRCRQPFVGWRLVNSQRTQMLLHFGGTISRMVTGILRRISTFGIKNSAYLVPDRRLVHADKRTCSPLQSRQLSALQSGLGQRRILQIGWSGECVEKADWVMASNRTQLHASLSNNVNNSYLQWRSHRPHLFQQQSTTTAMVPNAYSQVTQD